jgi:hypothetical protein
MLVAALGPAGLGASLQSAVRLASLRKFNCVAGVFYTAEPAAV